jgi:hypothetical protein
MAWLWRGPQGELVELLTMLPRRFPIPSVLALGVGLWLAWPMLMTSRTNGAVLPPGAPDVITTFIEDPMRAVTAVGLWKTRPGSILVLQGSVETQVTIQDFLRARNITGVSGGKVVTLTEGCDPFGYLTTLSRFLSRQPQPGRLTVVTIPAHRDRSVVTARAVFGSQGWQVDGLAAATGDNRPEAIWRLWRDQARVQIWRLTGWDGTTDRSICRVRGGG